MDDFAPRVAPAAAMARLGALVLRRRADAVRWTAALAAAFATVPVVLDAAGVAGASRFCLTALLPGSLSALCAWARRRLARRMRAGVWPTDEAEVRAALRALDVARHGREGHDRAPFGKA